ncbi:MAG: cytochrome c3 family protein [Gemmatimonadaceae bacterium]
MSVGRRVLSIVAFAALVAGTMFAAPIAARFADPPFPHDKHARLFPLCTTCHAGVVEPDRSLWPEPASCASCHDSIVKPRVQWQPRAGPRPGNRRFTHDAPARGRVIPGP